ncbi:hypothetical protein [Streptacidiphilus melanogenes]
MPREDWPPADDTSKMRALGLEADIARWGADLATGAAAGSTT